MSDTSGVKKGMHVNIKENKYLVKLVQLNIKRERKKKKKILPIFVVAVIHIERNNAKPRTNQYRIESPTTYCVRD